MVTKSDILSNISDLFASKQTLQSDSQVMGIPVWVILAGGIGYILWSSQKILSISSKLSEIERDQREELRRENESLRKKISELEDRP
jgi:hypothetical protein